MRVGVLALQGGVREHAALLAELGAEPVLVRRPDQLRDLDALALPGGESSVIDRLARSAGLFAPLRRVIDDGLPTLATCAGLILLARGVLDPAPGQQSLGVLDVDVRRNAFGPQLASAEVPVATTWGVAAVAFIRAPAVVRVGAGVQVLAEHAGRVVAVRQGAIIGLAFHPELTREPLFHERLLGLADARHAAVIPANRGISASSGCTARCRNPGVIQAGVTIPGRERAGVWLGASANLHAAYFRSARQTFGPAVRGGRLADR